jgi:hypothetical protein
MGIFKDIHNTSWDLATALDNDSMVPKYFMYVVWLIVMFIYLVIIKFILINTFNIIRKVFTHGTK